MKYVYYAIYDKAVAAYLHPFKAQRDAEALRMFGDLLKGDSPVSQHPEDYALFRLAEWEDTTGEFKPSPALHLANAHELQAQQATPPLSNGGVAAPLQEVQ